MKKFACSATIVLLLASCGPVSVYHKAGETVSRQKSDLLACKVEALEKAPVATQIRQSPPYFVPSRRYCRADGNCYHRGGYFAGGEIYSVDVNARLRGDLEAQCMAQRGYRPVSVPRCSAGSTAQSPQSDTAGAEARIPALTGPVCVVRNAQGDWQMVDASD